VFHEPRPFAALNLSPVWPKRLEGEALADCVEGLSTIRADDIAFVVALLTWASPIEPPRHGVDVVSGQRTTCEAGEAQGWQTGLQQQRKISL
jgi:hypothetical protein